MGEQISDQKIDAPLRLLCLMPTYGRPSLVANQIASFNLQNYPPDRRYLLIYDDGGQLHGEGDRWSILSSNVRENTLIDKYNRMLSHAIEQRGLAFDAVALMDDDDIYGPLWLHSHDYALRRLRPDGTVCSWSYPFLIYSLYGVDIRNAELPITEQAAGRFWASACVRRSVLADGFPKSNRVTFDQEALAHWRRKSGEPARPDTYYLPQYCYGWGRAGAEHDSARQRPQDGWRPVIGRLETQAGPVVPKMDGLTSFLWKKVWNAHH